MILSSYLSYLSFQYGYTLGQGADWTCWQGSRAHSLGRLVVLLFLPLPTPTTHPFSPPMSDRDRDYRARSRSRSRSPSRRDRDRNLKNRDKKSSSSSRRRDYSSASEEDVDLQAKFGVEEISQDDYFSKSNEFRAWLRDEKKKYLDQLSGEESRRVSSSASLGRDETFETDRYLFLAEQYFKKFVKVWNRGRLSCEAFICSSEARGRRLMSTRHRRPLPRGVAVSFSLANNSLSLSSRPYPQPSTTCPLVRPPPQRPRRLPTSGPSVRTRPSSPPLAP